MNASDRETCVAFSIDSVRYSGREQESELKCCSPDSWVTVELAVCMYE